MKKQQPLPHNLSDTSPRVGTRWGQDRRLSFIDFRLRWEGRINRGDLIQFFGISVPQASLDIARYSELAPGNLEYDRRARVYLATGQFCPLFPATLPQQYLNELLASTTGLLAPEATFIGWRPPVAAVPSPERAVSAEILASLLRAIRNNLAVNVLYQSMSRTSPCERTLTPHAVANDGFRWHVRAFCHSRQQFRDFVVGRMLSITGTHPSSVSPADDAEWSNVLTLVLGPHPDLSEAHKRVIELDYNMTNGETSLQCRQALLFYVLRRLGLSGLNTDPVAQQIVLKNETEIHSYMKRSNDKDEGGQR